MFLTPSGKPPLKKRKQDAGFDFFVDLKGTFPDKSPDHITLQPGEVVKLSVGCFCEFPVNTMWLWDVRSSVGLKGLDVTCRTIDNEYRGLLSVVVVNNGQGMVNIEHGERIAQLIPNPFNPHYEVEVVSSLDELSKTSRGTKGFGSTGRS